MLIKPKRITSKVGALAAVAAVAAVAAGCTAPAPVASQQKFGFMAEAYGSYGFGSLGATSAPSFVAGIGCTTEAGLVATNNGAAATLPTFGDVGAVKSRATSNRSTTTATSASTEDVAAADLLGGLVHVGAIQVASATTHTALGFHSSASTTMPSLVIAGHSISDAIRPNTVVPLAGLGTATLNEQSMSSSAAAANQTTVAIDVRVTTANSLHLPVGARLLVGVAVSGLTGPEQALLGGVAYGSSLIGTGSSAVADSGPSAVVGMPCLGTGGTLVTKTQAGISSPNNASTGTITDTARGTITSTSASGEMTSTVNGANLLSSIVTAGNIKADAHATSTNGKANSFSDAGSQLTNVVVSGHGGRLDNVPANTQLTIPGVGTLYLHRVIKTPSSIEVRMMELVVTVGGNQLPVGSDIKVAVAEATIRG